MPHDLTEHNTGLIEGSGTKHLWLGGTIPYAVRLESGDWRPYAPDLEKQRDPVETMGCVSFSHTNNLETQYKFFGIDINFSDRFLAKMSGTTQQGNYLDKVADTARLIGLVREDQWPNIPKAMTWDEYYKEIPQSVRDAAVKQNIQYESIVPGASELRYHLKQSPIQVTIPAPHPNHAVTLVYAEGSYGWILDHYNYQIRKITLASIATALKIVLTPMNSNAIIYKNGAEYQLALRAVSPQGFAQQLQDAGCQSLINPDGSPNFVEIDKIAHVL